MLGENMQPPLCAITHVLSLVIETWQIFRNKNPKPNAAVCSCSPTYSRSGGMRIPLAQEFGHRQGCMEVPISKINL